MNNVILFVMVYILSHRNFIIQGLGFDLISGKNMRSKPYFIK
ncbi:hypothetical protein SAMN05660293_02220 [Dyadobacter psychrophilus]|uniref:Uncharacterized protein n=1 Tax=Dyadobacter psychrophilus TaxID=651661 RepID=A0A1T5E8G0_9BACT|nr:hypothetical protein SAMN05660293_02220 [Dyadobacter psychrophilus]